MDEIEMKRLLNASKKPKVGDIWMRLHRCSKFQEEYEFYKVVDVYENWITFVMLEKKDVDHLVTPKKNREIKGNTVTLPWVGEDYIKKDFDYKMIPWDGYSKREHKLKFHLFGDPYQGDYEY